MIERRLFPAGIVYSNALHIFGGQDYDFYNTSTVLNSSEIVKEDGSSTKGPQLPEPIWQHAIASINSTVSIITGGSTVVQSASYSEINNNCGRDEARTTLET